jgi:hypothetical protein
MNKEQEQTKKPIILTTSQSEDAIKITATTILILGVALLVLKISKEMLKQLEGMGF